jgi:hypothetical protein
MEMIEVAGITAGLGALNLAKQLRRIKEGMNPKLKAMQGVMKIAAQKGIKPKKALQNLKGKV